MRKIFVLLIGFSLPAAAAAESYPTIETVRMVVTCMHDLGEQSEVTLYTCACRHDVIESEMSFFEYEQGNLYERHRGMTGKKGGIMRDAAGHAKELYGRLQKVREKAEKACPVTRHLEAPRLKEGEHIINDPQDQPQE